MDKATARTTNSRGPQHRTQNKTIFQLMEENYPATPTEAHHHLPLSHPRAIELQEIH
jgi:hypothetical protein